MNKDFDSRKYKLIKEIIKMDDESAIARLEHQIEVIQKEGEIRHTAIKPMRKTITLAEMRAEQHYAPIDEKSFFELAEKMGIEEPIEDLLAMLD